MQRVPEHLRLLALLHDAPEAYLGDVPRPLREAGLLSPLYAVAEDRIWQAICIRLELLPEERDREHVAWADDAELVSECVRADNWTLQAHKGGLEWPAHYGPTVQNWYDPNLPNRVVQPPASEAIQAFEYWPAKVAAARWLDALNGLLGERLAKTKQRQDLHK
jgi:hypothetical protein